jgi:hypothetical protein
MYDFIYQPFSVVEFRLSPSAHRNIEHFRRRRKGWQGNEMQIGHPNMNFRRISLS